MAHQATATPMVAADFPRAFLPLNKPHRYKICFGGRGGGRSWTIARLLLIESSKRPLRTLCTREYQRSIQESVHFLLAGQIHELQLPGWTVQRNEISCVNGSQFIFAGLRHEPHKIKSVEGLDRAWVEEAQAVSAESWRLLIPTVRKNGSEIWVSFNPDLSEDETYQRFVVNTPPDCVLIKTTWRDNPWFPETLARERDHDWATDPEGAAHIWDGEHRQRSQAQVFAGKWVVEDFEPAANWNGPYYGADWGFSQDPTALVRFWVDPASRLLIEHEAYGVGVDIDETPQLFRSVPGAAEHLIRADSARPETISHMNKNGFTIRSARKWTGCVEDGVTHLRGYSRIVIHPRCKHTRDEFHNYAYKVDKLSGDVLPVILDKWNHIIDSLRYGAEPLMRTRERSMASIV